MLQMRISLDRRDVAGDSRTMERVRFMPSQRSTSGMISLPNARTHSIDGEITSPNWFDSFKANGDP